MTAIYFGVIIIFLIILESLNETILIKVVVYPI